MVGIEVIKDNFYNFFDKNYSNYIIKKWLYKDKIYVVDIYFEGYKIGFDFYLENNSMHVDYIIRNINKSDNCFSKRKNNLYRGGDLTILLSTIDNFLEKLKKINDDQYDYMISVIIPVYNRENLIGDCIFSLNSQKLDPNKFEVIFVDDFSSDNSVDVIKENISNKLNYKILKRPINSGSASAPRNDGILAAKGKYIYFVDSDDYIYDYTLHDLLNMAENNSSDVVYAKYNGDKGRSWGKRPFSKGNIDSAFISDHHLVRSLMCSKLIRTSLLKNNFIFFPLDIKIGEDRVFMMSVLGSSSKVSILGEKPYYYITNHDSDKLTNSGSNLTHDYEVVSRVFKMISDCSLGEKNKILLFSCWMNVVLEAYIINKLKSKNHDLSKKQIYFNKIIFQFKVYSFLFDENLIYREFKGWNELFLKSDFNSLYNIACKK